MLDYGVSTPMEYDSAWEIVEERFPEAVKEGGIFRKRHQESWAVDWDASATEKKLGLAFKKWTEMVVEVVEQYLEITKEKKEGDSR